MSFWQNVGGTWRKGAIWQNVQGTWRKGVLWQNVGGVWKRAEGGGGGPPVGYSASASPANVYGSVARASGSRVNTNQTTITVSGGAAPYGVAWSENPDWTVETSSVLQARFSAIVGPGDSKTADFICTVTDAKGAITTATVTAEVANYYSGGTNNADIP